MNLKTFIFVILVDKDYVFMVEIKEYLQDILLT
jgi:hypothetical protein